MDALKSSEALIKALKAPTDPPSGTSLLKIELAQKAWDTQSLYVPSKAELLSDWLLAKLLKEKDNERHTNPVIDHRYWSLLSQILGQSAATQGSWVKPLVTRIPLFPTISSLLRNLGALKKEDLHGSSVLLPSAYDTLRIIVPLALPKASVDHVMDCFWEILALFSEANITNLNLSLGRLVVLSLDSSEKSFASTANKKKISNSLLDTHLVQWIRATNASPFQRHNVDIANAIYAIGSEMIFTPDSLRPLVDSFTAAQNPTNLFDHIRQALSSSNDITPIVDILPRLFASYLISIRKHRSTLFPQSHTQSSSTTKIKEREAGIRFFSSCIPILSLDRLPPHSVWKTIAALLEIAEKEGLFDTVDNSDGNILDKVAGDGVIALKDPGSLDFIFKSLSHIHRLDPDILNPHIPQIFLHLLTTPPTASSVEFLTENLSTHTKSTSLPSLLQTLASTLASTTLSRDSYLSASSSSVLNPPYSTRLAKAISTFLTPSQTPDVIQPLVEMLISAWETLFQDIGSKSMKKQHHSSTMSERAAVQFSLQSRLLVAIIPAISLHSLSAAALSSVQRIVEHLRSTAIIPAVRLGVESSNDADRWSREVVCSSALRLSYILERKPLLLPSRNLGDDADVDDRFWDQALGLMKSADTLPELVVEMSRSSLYHIANFKSNSHMPLFAVKPSTSLDAILDILDLSFPGDHEGTVWKGDASASLETRKQAGVALWAVVMERWIGVFDEFASTEQRGRLVDMFLRLHSLSSSTPMAVATSATTGLTLQTILQRTLSSAHFLELHNIRSALLSAVDAHTSIFHGTNASDLLQSPKLLKIKSSALSISLRAFLFLLSIPVEYLTRNIRTELVKRAFVADVYLYLRIKKEGAEMMWDNKVEWRAIIRCWVLRVVRDSGGIELLTNASGLMIYLVSPMYSPPLPTETYIQSTLNLAELAHLSALRTSGKSETGAIQDVLRAFAQPALFSAQDASFDITQQSLLRLMLLFISHTTCSQISQVTADLLRNIASPIVEGVSHQLEKVVEIPDDSLFKNVGLVEAWTSCLELQRWLGDGASAEQIGTKLLSIAIRLLPNSQQSSSIKSQFCATLLSLLIQELKSSVNGDDNDRWDIPIAAYSHFRSSLALEQDETSLDIPFSRSCKSLSPSVFASILKLIQEEFRGFSPKPSVNDEESGRIVALVRLSDILLRHAPEGTFKTAQEHGSKSIQFFAQGGIFDIEGSVLTLSILSFTSKHCSERSSHLTLLDLGFIFTLLSQALHPSSTHSSKTSVQTYHTLLSITSSLIRLRRDLIIHTLPHLSHILKQLLTALQAPKSGLGGKQRRSVGDLLPQWISPDEPFGVEEAKGCARLITSLTVKTTPSITTASTSTTTTNQSLSQPFSKHAPYILTHYISLLLNPFSSFSSSASMKKELEVGVYALCGMMGENGRDSIMSGGNWLDVSGRTVLRLIWGEFEKQRYVGKG